ncbi:MAG TPA: succinate dehydrogenase, cytochrome b556 subunit [Dehalococcoidia bacterium]|nr:succinate dehydrogenase, cytochrome b556 subunit [Dehalococcoidia bacterium]HAI09697.1 succinate dehydrogenase, cytochrome b556 subunit [Dehalococcoidia bacterium]
MDRNAGTRAGWWAWFLQRLTGVALVGYLFLHILVISTVQAGQDAFDSVLIVLQKPFFVVLDLFLIAAVVYHALNGVRVLLFDLGIGLKRQAGLFWVCMVLTTILTLVAGYFSLPLIFRN